MTHPALVVKAVLEEKRTAGKAAWKDFEEERTRIIRSGTDLRKDGKAFRRLDALYGEYEKLAAECSALEDQLFERLDVKTHGPGTGFGRVPGIADAFVKNLGGPSGIDGIKALVSGASPVPPFFDERLRQLPQRSRFVRSLIPVVPADGDTVSYVRQSVRTIAAAPVATGAVKPTSTITIERVDATVTTIAHLSEPIEPRDFCRLRLANGVSRRRASLRRSRRRRRPARERKRDAPEPARHPEYERNPHPG
jgi:HK97 family phage major capsid protein